VTAAGARRPHAHGATGAIGHATAATQVSLELLGLTLGKTITENIEIGLVIEPEGTIIKISRTNRRPVSVDHDDFAVKHRRLVLKERHASLEQPPPARLRSPTHQGHV
jgi:hypothetical protein